MFDLIYGVISALRDAFELIGKLEGTFETMTFWTSMFIIMCIVLAKLLPALPDSDESAFDPFLTSHRTQENEKDDAISIETVPKDDRVLPDKVTIKSSGDRKTRKKKSGRFF